MINIFIIFNTGEYATGKFNGTLDEARAYYLDREFPVDGYGEMVKVDAVTEIKE